MIVGVYNDEILNRVSIGYASKVAKHIDDSIFNAIPKWKGKLLRKYPHRLLARILRVNIEIEHRESISLLGKEITVKVNGHVVKKVLVRLSDNI